ncbi:MAG TPA: hypothetical protein VLT82_04375 [Myxococcaceae bacterium]|nr:hypothetical protein [Myxococcaceae bacterium]
MTWIVAGTPCKLSDVTLLPPALESALSTVPESQATRLRQVCHGAANALARLTDLDLLQYESPVTSSSQDLSTWEEMAPVVASTLRDVNAFIDLVRTQLAAQPLARGNGLASLVEDAVLDDAARARLETVLQKAAEQLFEQVQALGAKVRDPSVVADRWNLLAEVQASRTRFREHIGTLVFDLVVPFADVERSEVVPGHAEEEAGAVAVRAAVADLRRVLESRATKLRQASAEDVQWHAQHLEQEMDAFGRTAPYRSLRAQDKRRLIEYRHEVRSMAAVPLPAKADVMEVCQRVLELVKSLAVVNQRALLRRHDHEVWARSGVKLEQSEALLPIDRRAAAVALAEAAELAAGLYGRSEPLDDFLRRARKQSLSLVPAEEVGPVVEEFRAVLAGLPLAE